MRILNYIGGALQEPVSGSFLPNICPATGAIYGELPDSDERDVALAVAAASLAAPAWGKTSPEERGNTLQRLADLILENLDEFAHAESRDNGKPYLLAREVDIPRAAKNFSFFASAILHEGDHAYHSDAETLNYTHHTPLGVVGCISPWNLPLYLLTWKLAPALASGNCVIAKPSELTPATAFLLCRLATEAGLPPGVLNIVHGLGAKVGVAIVEHEKIRAVSFTGGTKTGADIASRATKSFKKLCLELGGKNPALVFADCDYPQTIPALVRASFTNQGQICLCSSRILVERSIYERFVADFVHAAKKLVVGDPMQHQSNLGAVVSEAHLEKILSYIALAREEGGTIHCGGERLDLGGALSKGYYIAPTVITDLSTACRVNQEEIFGPVVTIQAFDSDSEALEFANATPYGLAATVWTSNLSRAHRVSQALESGIVWVNTWMKRDLRTPFGGVKQSGMGKEGGFEALSFFRDTKNICMKL